MISLFTTAKDFVGREAVNQLNALRSWKAAPVDVEIFVFGDSQGTRDVVRDLELIHIQEVGTSPHGAPLVNSMFESVHHRSSHDICCFVNADIILTSRFFTSVASIHQQLQRHYLVVGQRYDVNVDAYVDFGDDWEQSFLQQYGSHLVEHPPLGSDFFVFPKGQYQSGDIPDLVVGRWSWDLWMIYQARMRKLRTIDLSATTKVIHQNHEYAHEKQAGSAEDAHNLSYLPKKGERFHLLACDYCYRHGKLEKNFARGDYKYYRKTERLLGRRMLSESLRHWSTAPLRWIGSRRAA